MGAILNQPPIEQGDGVPKAEKNIRDGHCLREAEGWLELGSSAEALEELAQISPRGASHIDVLRARYSAFASAEHWNLALMISEVAVGMFPTEAEGWLWRAHATRVVTQSASMARDALEPAARRFQNDPIVLLNLALYERQLGNAGTALQWLAKTRRAAGKGESASMVRQLVEQDPGLWSLWDQAAEQSHEE